jgi:hypothetical protein
MYREKYGRQTAAAMYRVNKPTEEVAQMLLAEGAAPEQAAELAHTYYQQHLSRGIIASKKRLKEARMYQTVGLVLAGSSLFLSFLTYLLLDDGGSFIGFYGLLAVGLLALTKGRLDKRSAAAALKQEGSHSSIG